MMGDEWNNEFCDQSTPSHENEHEHEHQDSPGTDQHDFSFDLLSLVSKTKDYYRILEVDFDASEEKWHPDKQKDQNAATCKFQEINEAYQVLSDPIKRQEYDSKGMFYVSDYNFMEYLNRFKGLILTCNGLGIRH